MVMGNLVCLCCKCVKGGCTHPQIWALQGRRGLIIFTVKRRSSGWGPGGDVDDIEFVCVAAGG